MSAAPARTAAASPAFAPVTAVPLYRFYQPAHGFHLYTADPDERAALKELPEWVEEQQEGYVFRQQMPGTRCRLSALPRLVLMEASNTPTRVSQG